MATPQIWDWQRPAAEFLWSSRWSSLWYADYRRFALAQTRCADSWSRAECQCPTSITVGTCNTTYALVLALRDAPCLATPVTMVTGANDLITTGQDAYATRCGYTHVVVPDQNHVPALPEGLTRQVLG